jgi:hypothetical protein
MEEDGPSNRSINDKKVVVLQNKSEVKVILGLDRLEDNFILLIIDGNKRESTDLPFILPVYI